MAFTAVPFTRTVLGYPRIGPHRELKQVLERYWSGSADREELLRTAADVGRESRTTLFAAGLDSVPVGTSLYDHVVDTAVMLGAVPNRFAAITDELDRYFAMARGTAAVAPLEMTKWFDTNYHYLVPEIDPAMKFSLHPAKLLDEVTQAVAEGLPARPVILGPVSFLLLSKSVDSGEPGLVAPADPLARLDDLIPLYVRLLELLAQAGAEWVQLDEPVLVLDRTPAELTAVQSCYRRLSAGMQRPALLIATYFGDPGAALESLLSTDVDAVALDLVSGSLPSSAELGRKLLVAGVVDGRNVWRIDPDRALGLLRAVADLAGAVAVSTSCSLLHVPYSLDAETGIDPQLRSWLAFADEKVAEVVMLNRAFRSDSAASDVEIQAAREAITGRRSSGRLQHPRVRARVGFLRDEAFRRGDPAHREMVQASRTPLPKLPTTTIGSFPQTGRVRAARSQLRAGTITVDTYDAVMRAEIAEVIALQEDIGFDVLVHGEPERNDMVQYFAERLDGFAVTDFGWVQSYGSRCVRPPILFGDVQRSAPMTVAWARYAQSLTVKPVKGMLTGPVTLLAWSFVRDDQALADTALQVALAIRDETVDLENAGIRIIQVDEPALRELLPPRRADQAEYLGWAVRAFQLATSGVSAGTAVHTHLCYSEFGEIIDAISDLGADVTSVEAARSHMEILDDLARIGYARGVGPGVYDIHSPRVPDEAEIKEALEQALHAVDPRRLWVNPDCGLKTRRPEEVEAALRNMVDATRELRLQLR